MKDTSRFKRTLMILLLGVFGLSVIIGGYFVFHYPSIVPPLHHEKQADTIKNLASNLPSETAQPLAMQPTHDETAMGFGQSPAIPSTQAAVTLPAKGRGAPHSFSPNLQSTQAQESNPANGLGYLSGSANNAIRNLPDSTVNLTY